MHTAVPVSTDSEEDDPSPILRDPVDLPTHVVRDRHVLRRPRGRPDRRGRIGRRRAVRTGSGHRGRAGRRIARRSHRRRPPTGDRGVEPERSGHRPARVRPVRRNRRRIGDRDDRVDHGAGRGRRPHRVDGTEHEPTTGARAGLRSCRRDRRHDRDGAQATGERLRRRWLEGAPDRARRRHTARRTVRVAAPSRNPAAGVDMGAPRPRQGDRMGHRRDGRTERHRPASRVRRGRGDSPEGSQAIRRDLPRDAGRTGRAPRRST